MKDSIFHAFDADGREHMEYLAYRGEFPEAPLDELRIDFRRYYPILIDGLEKGDFDSKCF